MAEEGRSNERHEVMTYCKVTNDAILATDLLSGFGQQSDQVGRYETIWHGPVLASF